MLLRFVKRRVGRNIVRILQQKWEEDEMFHEGYGVWRDVPMEEPGQRPTADAFKSAPD
jgi:hypothetical protein